MFDTEEEIPSYMIAADTHNVANGKPDLTNYSNFDTVTKGAFASLVRGVASTVNIVPAVANWAGADIPEMDTYNVLKAFDDDLAVYYSDHRETIDIVGDVIASVVPGMGGVKALNYAQKGLAGLSHGNAGKNVLRSIGTLPTQSAKYAAEAQKQMQQGSVFSMINQNTLKSFGTAYAQNALEFAAFETAAAITLGNRSPLYEDHTATDIVYNAALGGGLVGIGILGTVSAVQVYGGVKRARMAFDKAVNPLKVIYDSPQGVEGFVEILNLKKQLDTPQIHSGSAAEIKAIESRNRQLATRIETKFAEMAGDDAEMGKVLFQSIQALDKDQAWKALLGFKEAGRVSLVTEAEKRIFAAEEAKKLIAAGNTSPKLAATVTAASDDFVKYLDLSTGNVSHTLPKAPDLADLYSVAEIEKMVGRVKPDAKQNWSPMGKDLNEVEARYIAAAKTKLGEYHPIASNDLPVLEAAWNQNVQNVVVNGVQMDRMSLWNHIQTKKESLLDDIWFLEDINPVSETTFQIAKRLNLSTNLVEGAGADVLDTAAWLAKSDFATNYIKPSIAKISYKGNHGVSGNELQGMVAIKQMQQLQEQTNLLAVTEVFGQEAVAKLIKLTDTDVLAANSLGAGAGIATLASGEYLTTASKMEWLGKVTNQLKTEAQAKINDSLQPLMHAVLQNTDAGNELLRIRQQIVSTGEKYVFKLGEIIHKDIYDYEVALSLGKKAAKPKLDPNVLERIPIATQEAKDFLDGWVTIGNEHLRKERVLANAIGRARADYSDLVYFPQPDSRHFPYFSFVVPKNSADGATQMIWARSPEHLAELEAKVPADYRLVRKTEQEEYFRLKGIYDHDLGMNSREVLTDLKRTGAASPFFPIGDSQTLLQQMLDFRHKVSDKQVRDGISLHNSVGFSELRQLDSEFRAIQTSTRKGGNVDSQYESYVKTALDIPRNSHVPVWTEFNNLAENVFTKLVGKLGDIGKKAKSPDDLAALNTEFEKNGIRGFKDAFTEILASHPADKKELSRFVLTMNSILTSTILRLDPMNALTNGVGLAVKGGSEFAVITKLIEKEGLGGELNKLMGVVVPGTDVTMKSMSKLVTGAYKDFFSLKLGSSPEAIAKYAKYEANGWMPSMMDQLRQIADGATLNMVETTGQVRAKTEKAIKDFATLGEKWTGNKTAEEMNRYVAAHIADSVSGILVKAGKMSEPEQLAFINTFTNRVQGNYLASQRPLMFQGPIGHAISLFQTYSLNMMQHIFRHIENGDKKQLAILLGLQTSMFGMNGLPAFSLLNDTLVGNAAGNLEHKDLYTTLRAERGSVGDFLLYGGLSNATGLGLYSRGDLNPRHATILPSSVDTIPFVQATTTLFKGIYDRSKEISGGSDVGATLLRGLEHSGISRPLAGLASAANGYATSRNNQLLVHLDTYSLASLGRIAGARPYDEAVTRDAYYRVQQYESKDKATTDRLGSVIRDRLREGNIPSQEEYNQFLAKYVEAGHDQKNFIKFWQRQVKDAPKSRIDEMIEHSKSRYSNYLQTMSGEAEEE